MHFLGPLSELYVQAFVTSYISLPSNLYKPPSYSLFNIINCQRFRGFCKSFVTETIFSAEDLSVLVRTPKLDHPLSIAYPIPTSIISILILFFHHHLLLPLLLCFHYLFSRSVLCSLDLNVEYS